MELKGFGFHDDIITCLDFHPKLPVILTGSLDHTACMTNYLTGKVRHHSLKFNY